MPIHFGGALVHDILVGEIGGLPNGSTVFAGTNGPGACWLCGASDRWSTQVRLTGAPAPAMVAPWLGSSPLEFRAILNEMNNQTTQLRVLDAHECLCQSQSVRGGEKFVDVRRDAWSSLSSSWGAFEKERNRHLKDLGNVLQPAGADPILFFPFSYFCTCWNVIPMTSPSFSWLIPSIIRRIRTRRACRQRD